MVVVVATNLAGALQVCPDKIGRALFALGPGIGSRVPSALALASRVAHDLAIASAASLEVGLGGGVPSLYHSRGCFL